jgi:hypothetical protein
VKSRCLSCSTPGARSRDTLYLVAPVEALQLNSACPRGQCRPWCGVALTWLEFALSPAAFTADTTK